MLLIICLFHTIVKDNLFEWHFTVRGPSDSDFQGGVYHGRITLPPDYPMKPPSIMLLTVSIKQNIYSCQSILKGDFLHF